ncbi:MAG: 1-deoxy-D-xylulose-5-phosphate reductoisomerase [Oscillospiraceae bacterium]
MKNICILGSTGSIGTQSLEICDSQGFKVVGLSAHSNIELLVAKVKKYCPKKVCIFNKEKYEELKLLINDINVEILTGIEGLISLASMEECDVLLNCVVGMVGLKPTLAAIDAKKTIALANKETLVTGGKLVIESAKKNGVSILPIDSEHSAIFQSMQGNNKAQVKKIILTASGGPFFGKTKKELESVTLKDALNHPNWSMGSKITIDSATLMNKGLELIEACWLFDKSPDEVEIVVHRESVIHSLVEYDDNAVMAQLGVPDMKIPIQYALTYPDRFKCDTGRLSLTEYGKLTFFEADEDTFICLKACKEAIKRGGLYPTIVNGANEQAVELFLNGEISFLDIGKLVYGSLSIKYDVDDFDVDDILIADRLAREFVLSKK